MDKEYEILRKKLVDLRTEAYKIERKGNEDELTKLKKEILEARHELAKYKFKQINLEEKKEGR